MLAIATKIGPIKPSISTAKIIELNQYGHLGRSGGCRRTRSSGTAEITAVTMNTPDHKTGMCDIDVPGSAHAFRGASNSKNAASVITRCAILDLSHREHGPQQADHGGGEQTHNIAGRGSFSRGVLQRANTVLAVLLDNIEPARKSGQCVALFVDLGRKHYGHPCPPLIGWN